MPSSWGDLSASSPHPPAVAAITNRDTAAISERAARSRFTDTETPSDRDERVSTVLLVTPPESATPGLNAPLVRASDKRAPPGESRTIAAGRAADVVMFDVVLASRDPRGKSRHAHAWARRLCRLPSRSSRSSWGLGLVRARAAALRARAGGEGGG